MFVRTVLTLQDLYVRVRYPRLWREALAPFEGKVR